ncbi:elongation factor P maturation arginine rhamnosyltransferase EarP [Aquabacterium sp.]|uniref:elongation factor P maturation arginine rhamnosyltransferase EarP n=1 Tax=Aquabacterium sp. TaxID=1872578 RepID=UPI0035AD82E6
MLWDVFCRVIDNFGDVGVCWRLACNLAQRGHRVRLWMDNASALTWMAPALCWERHPNWGVQTGRMPGIEVVRWDDCDAVLTHDPDFAAGEVVVEAFGCNPPDAFVARMQRAVPPAWINLEYLSAEDYVERSHKLMSPVWSSPGAGLRKHFFYPGFTPATGGLLRESDLPAAHAAFDAAAQAAWLARFGIQPQPNALLVSLFCYPSAPVNALLDQLLAQARGTLRPVHVLLTAGHASRLAQAWAEQHPQALPMLHLHALPLLSHADFDHLLWSCDLNLVRGEDSAVRALWAGHPHVWQIYEQDDGVHADKLRAFMDRWMATWPDQLRQDVAAWWMGWNGLAPLPDELPDFASDSAPWRTFSAASHATLTAQTDLVTQLIDFVTCSG